MTDPTPPAVLARHLDVLREMFAVCANERRMQEADALAAAIDCLAQPQGAVAWIKPEHIANLHAVPALSHAMNITPLSAAKSGNRIVPLFTHPAAVDAEDAALPALPELPEARMRFCTADDMSAYADAARLARGESNG